MGYEKASLRAIAGKTGMTSAGLYRHFKDKEEMFAVLVEPALKKLRDCMSEHEREEYDRLRKRDLDSIFADNMETHLFETVVYPNFDAFKLLLCRSAGTRYENFVDRLVMTKVKTALAFLKHARSMGLPVRDVEERELHLLITAYVTALTESVVHDFTPEQTCHYLQTHQAFFRPGFRAVLGI